MGCSQSPSLDLVGYQHRAGGLHQVATVLAELSERLDADKRVAVAGTAPPAWSQRLGYLLERIGTSEKAAPLKAWVEAHARDSAVLVPGSRRDDPGRDAEWKLYLNAVVEPKP